MHCVHSIMKTNPLTVLGLGLVFLGATGDAGARPWKDVEGRVIEADFVSSDGEEVVIRKGGKEFTLPLSRLSAADREWISAQEPAAPDPAETAATGLIKNHPVTVHYRETPKDWADGKLARKCSRAEYMTTPVEAKHVSKFDDCVSQDDQTCLVYVPASYNGSTPYGLYLHINSGDNGAIPGGYQAVLDERKIILVSANKTSNMRAHWERVSRSMNALATAHAQWKIDPDRVYVGGSSGGGHMAFLTHAIYSNEFRGAISHAAQSYPPDMNGSGSHFGPMEESDLRKGRRAQNYWLVIIGENDKRNLPETRRTAPYWKKMPVTYRCDEIPGMGHSPASPEVFAKSIDWLESNPENSEPAKSKD